MNRHVPRFLFDVRSQSQLLFGHRRPIPWLVVRVLASTAGAIAALLSFGVLRFVRRVFSHDVARGIALGPDPTPVAFPPHPQGLHRALPVLPQALAHPPPGFPQQSEPDVVAPKPGLRDRSPRLPRDPADRPPLTQRRTGGRREPRGESRAFVITQWHSGSLVVGAVSARTYRAPGGPASGHRGHGLGPTRVRNRTWMHGGGPRPASHGRRGRRGEEVEPAEVEVEGARRCRWETETLPACKWVVAGRGHWEGDKATGQKGRLIGEHVETGSRFKKIDHESNK